MDHDAAQSAICSLYGCGGGGGMHVGYPPCMLAQNAMIPCGSKPSKPVGVDPNVVGTWDLPLKDGVWVLKVLREGTYEFHSEAKDGAPSHSGTFSASDGRWSLKANTGYTDGGSYLFQSPDTWIVTGRLGAAAWRHPPITRPACAPTPHRSSTAAGVDPNVVGHWEVPVKGGTWIWDISGDGTYKFHSEAHDGAPSHSGKFAASNGLWSLTATSGYTDGGYYLFQAPDTWLVSGHLGAAAWRHTAPCN